MSSAEGLVVPKPGIPKTLGILNVIFGVILVLFGICGLGLMVLAPKLVTMGDGFVKKAQADVEARNQAIVKQYDEQIAAEPDENKKKAIEAMKSAVIARQPKINPVDLSTATETLNDPKIMAVTYLTSIIGLILSSLLLASGIGLIRLKSWGGKLGMVWGVLTLLFLGLTLVLQITIVVPANKPIVAKQIAKLEDQAKGTPPNSAENTALKMTKIFAGLTVPLVVAQTAGYSIYPVVLLILLSTKGARAALQGPKSELAGEF